MRRKHKVLLLLASTLLCRILFSAPVHSINVAQLCADAELIAQGEVTSITKLGPTTLPAGNQSVPAVEYSARIKTDRFLKGQATTASLEVNFALPDAPIGLQGVTAGEYGIFFLSTDENGGLRFTDPLYPALPSIPGVAVSPGSYLDEVTWMLGDVVMRASAQADFQKALAALGTLKTEPCTAVLHAALKASSGQRRLRIAALLVARNDIEGLEVVADALTSPAGVSREDSLILAGSVEGLKDPRAIPVLARLLRTQGPYAADIRRSVASSLRQTDSRQALRPLASLLTDSDLLTRYYAVSGLGRITGQEGWIPTYEEFRDREHYYVSHWLDWTATNFH